MLKNRNELEIEIKLLFKLYESDRRFHEELLEKTKNKMDQLRVSKYWTTIGNSPIILTDLELGLLTQVSNEIIKRRDDEDSIPDKIKPSVEKIQKNIKLEEWFTPSEIISINSMSFVEQKPVEKDNPDPVVFKNVVPFNGNDSWLTTITYDELINKIMKTSNIKYNFDTQRDPLIIEKYGLILYQQFVDSKRVDEMSKKMVLGTFENNMITLNILDNGGAKFQPPNDHDSNFYFFKDDYSVINCIDGYHRSLAIQKAVSQKPELGKNRIALKITFYDVKKAQNVIKQECISTNQNISQARQKAFEIDKISNTIRDVNSMYTSEDNFLHEKIADISQEVIKFHRKFVTFDIFKSGLEDEFSDLIEGGYQRKKIAEYLVEFFNVIGFKFKEDFENIIESQKKNIKSNNNTFYIYLLLAKKLYNSSNWEKDLMKILDAIDWSIENNDWNELKMFASNFGKTRRKKIKNYLENKNYFID